MLGWPRAQVEAWAAQQDPPVTSEGLNAAYAACVERWISEANMEDATLYALHVARREELYRRSIANQDFALAHKILVDQAKLQQQYKSEKARAETASKADELAARINARAAGRPKLRAVT